MTHIYMSVVVMSRTIFGVQKNSRDESILPRFCLDFASRAMVHSGDTNAPLLIIAALLTASDAPRASVDVVVSVRYPESPPPVRIPKHHNLLKS